MANLLTKLYVKGIMAKENAKNFFKSERGEANIIAIILVLAIVIALALVFRNQIKNLFDSIWGNMTEDVNSALTNY